MDRTTHIQSHPSYKETHYSRSLPYATKSMYDEAYEEWITNLQVKFPTTKLDALAIIYYDRALGRAIQEEYKKAVEDFTYVIEELDPKYVKAYYNRGNVYAIQKKYKNAIADFTTAIELKPGFAEAYNNRGTAYATKDTPDYDHAIADFTKALELKPGFAEAYNNRGTAHHSKGDYKHAIADFTTAIELKPDYAEAYYNRGNAYATKDTPDYKHAIHDFIKAVEKSHPESSHIIIFFSTMLDTLQQWHQHHPNPHTFHDCHQQVLQLFYRHYSGVAAFEQELKQPLSPELKALLKRN